MKKSGIINAQLARHIAGLRHTDLFVVADAGLPVPASVPTIDLAIAYGLPALADVLPILLAEVVVEHGWAASEIAKANPACERLFEGLVPGLERISHEDFKRLVGTAVFVARTGEASPYANIILRAGVPFG